MPTHVVTFRVEYDASYERRWTSIVDTIRKEASGNLTFEEMTSVIVINSPKSAEDLASSIYIRSLMDGNKDRLVVFNMTSHDYAMRGSFENPGRLATVTGLTGLGAALALYR